MVRASMRRRHRDSPVATLSRRQPWASASAANQERRLRPNASKPPPMLACPRALLSWENEVTGPSRQNDAGSPTP
jgi:hypothetical protein